jgi:hypothetical protein
VSVVVEVKILDTTAVSASGLLEGGGMSPSPPVEPAVKVLLPIVKFALPNETGTTLLGIELGGNSPFPCALVLVAVEPDCVKGPTVTVTMTIDGGGAIPSVAVEMRVLVDEDMVKLFAPDGAVALDEATDAGGIKPSPPVERPVAVDPEVEKTALPALMMVVVLTNTDGTDELDTGGMTPPFAVEV